MILFNVYYDDEFLGRVKANNSEEAEKLTLELLSNEGLHPDPISSLVRVIIC
jgi:hypothetical protein